MVDWSSLHNCFGRKWVVLVGASELGTFRVESVVNVNNWAVRKPNGWLLCNCYIHEMVPCWFPEIWCQWFMIHVFTNQYTCHGICLLFLFWMDSISNSLCFQAFTESLSLRCLRKKLIPILNLLLLEYWNEVVRVVVGMSSSIDVFYWRILRCTWTCEEWLNTLSWEHVLYPKTLFEHDFPFTKDMDSFPGEVVVISWGLKVMRVFFKLLWTWSVCCIQ